MNKATVAMVKSVQPFRDTGVAEESKEWTPPAVDDFSVGDFSEFDVEEKTRVLSHFAWSFNTPHQSFEDMKFPHNLPSKNGVGPAVLS